MVDHGTIKVKNTRKDGRKATRSIFVMGSARSGTELVRGMLNRHHDVHLAAETHYFDDLRPRLGARAVAALEGEGRTRAIDYFRALRHRAYGLAGNADDGDWTREMLDHAARAIGTGGDAIFEAYCRLTALRSNKLVWGEKTPRHVFRGREILATYPDAHVVVMLRDVRGVVASYRDWRNRWYDRKAIPADLAEAVAAEERRTAASYSLTLIALLWCSAARTAVRLHKEFGPERVTLLRFEDVLCDPEEAARLLCCRTGLPFDQVMLDASVVNSSYVTTHARTGFDATAGERWRERLSMAERRHLDLVAGPILTRLGYPRERLGISIAHSGSEFVKCAVAVARALFRNRTRMANPGRYVLVRLIGLTR